VPELWGYIGYYIAGYYFAKYKLSKKTEYIIYALGVLPLILAVFGTSFIAIRKNVLDPIFLECLTSHMMLLTIAVFLLVKNGNCK